MKILLSAYSILLVSFLLSINIFLLEGIPHVPDSTAYLFMAKMFASGHLIQDIPIPPQFVDFFRGILDVSSGQWLFQYPFGHPLILVPGIWIGFPNIIPPLVGASTIILLFFIARSLYGIKTAIFILPLPLLSPFFLSNASSFMSHNTAAFYLVAALFFLVFYFKNEKIYNIFLSGLFIGLLFNTRPLTSLPFLILFGTIILLQKNYQRKNILFYLIGFAVMFGLYLSYNYMTTGEFTQFQYYDQNRGLFDTTSTSLLDSIGERLNNVAILFSNFGPMLYNIMPVIIYPLLLVPFILKKDIFWDRVFLIALFTLPFVYFFYNGTFIMYGPRFWYEILPFVFLLTARSITLLSERKYRTTILIFLFFSLVSILTWTGIIPSQNPDVLSPLKMQDLKGINAIYDSIAQVLEANNITSGVIFVEECIGGHWWCYGSVFHKNTPDMNTQLIFVKDLGTANNLLLKKYYPEKRFYKINYYTREVKIIAD